MTDQDITKLINQHDPISWQIDRSELEIVLRELVAAIDRQDGAVVEFGCYMGSTSQYIRRVMDALKSHGQFHVYDSFAGLPPKQRQDVSPLGEQFTAGALWAHKKDFIREFKKAGLRLPYIHKAWFGNLTPDDVPDDIAFAFLDGDYYESTKTPLELITPKLLPGATIVVDDYGNQALPGARIAVDEWCHKQGLGLKEVESLAIVYS